MTDTENAVVVKDLYKSFKLPNERSSGVKQHIVNFFRRKKGYEVQQVLEDVSFEIKKGEFFGIVGRNGSGKSTLLKLLAGIYVPDKGLSQVNGSLTPFIELGVGFNPELTGRENVFLNGALLGFGKKEVEAMYDEIVDFAELERFMDQRLKNYSSGMQVRLAFSIAIRARSDILLIDEVLAVGDAAFQQKCFDYFDLLKREHRTIIFISHDMNSVKKYCDRSLYLKNGKVAKIGSSEEIAALYEDENDDKVAQNTQEQNHKDIAKSDLRITTTDTSGVDQSSYTYNSTININVEWGNAVLKKDVKTVGVAIFKENQCVFGTNTLKQNVKLTDKTITLSIKANLGKGKYKIVAGLFGARRNDAILFNSEGPEFFVRQEQQNNSTIDWEGNTKLEFEWKIK